MSTAGHIPLAERSAVSPFHVMEVVEAARAIEAAGGDVVHLEVGQPATAAPQAVIDAAKRALDTDRLGYGSAFGYEPLREAISAHYDDWYGAQISPDQIMITAGATGGCVLAFLVSFDVGDRVALPSPGYPCYRNILQSFGVEVVDVPVDASTNFQPTPALLAAAGPLDGVVLASPSNPTGTMVTADELTAIATWCDAHGVRLISDEIYHGLSYGPEVATAATRSPNAIVVNSFSKYFSMTGWRLGWTVASAEVTQAIIKMAANVYIAPSALSQIAAVAAFECHDELQANIARYRTNRGILLEGLPTVGLDRMAPADGAFYIYAAVDHLCDDSQTLARTWLEDWGVAATPGIDFDQARGHQWVRFSFAGSPAEMHEAIERLTAWKSACLA